jgi:hypothetical protein
LRGSIVDFGLRLALKLDRSSKAFKK